MLKWNLKKTARNKLFKQFLLKASTLRNKRKSTKKILIPFLLFKIIIKLLLKLRKTKRMLSKIKKKKWLQLMKNWYKIKLMLKWKMKMSLWTLNKLNKFFKILKFQKSRNQIKSKKFLNIQKLPLRKKPKPKTTKKWKKEKMKSKKLSANWRLHKLMLKSKMCIFTPQETFQEKLQKTSKDKTLTSELNSREKSWAIWKIKKKCTTIQSSWLVTSSKQTS